MKVADDEIYLVVNAGCREKDLAHIGKHLDKYKVNSQPELIFSGPIHLLRVHARLHATVAS